MYPGHAYVWPIDIFPQGHEIGFFKCCLYFSCKGMHISRSVRLLVSRYTPLSTWWPLVSSGDYLQAKIINCTFLLKQICKQIILIVPVFPCRDIYGDNDPSRQPERTNEAAATYAQACITVAKELDHPVIDIWTKMQQYPDWQTSALRYKSILTDPMFTLNLERLNKR